VATSQGAFTAETLVVASGGLSVPSLGGSGYGYELAEQFGHRLLPTSAALVPLTFTDATKGTCSSLAGVSCEVSISSPRATFREDLLFTHRGLSGPAVLQISSYWQPGEAVCIDLLPGQDAYSLFRTWKREHPRVLLRTQLGTVCQDNWCWNSRRCSGQTPERGLCRLAGPAIAGSGIPTASLKLQARRHRRVPDRRGDLGAWYARPVLEADAINHHARLFIIGEVVDVTGHLGGFNFQWAWSSGHAAGLAV
jgi:predicted flavoprotein YhiN